MTMRNPCRILIVDDHELASTGIALALSRHTDFVIAGTLNRGKGVVSNVQQNSIDVVLLDINLPDVSGLDVLIELMAIDHVAVVILTGEGRAQDFNFALKVGAHGLVSKSDPVSAIVDALKATMQGEIFVSPRVKSLLDQNLEPAVTLSPRQTTILHYLAAGETNKEIGYRLQISPPTVSFHLRELRQKLGVAGNKKILGRASELGLLKA